jgi:hypothetical protein
MKIDMQKYHQKLRDNQTVAMILGFGALCFAIIMWILASVLE